MLGKAIKYEFSASWRTFLGVYLALFICAVLVALSIKGMVAPGPANVIIGIAAGAVMIALIVVTIISMFDIFNRNMFGSQGYLTLSLPIKSITLISSKLIVGTLWIIITAAVAMLAMFVTALIGAGSDFWVLWDYIPLEYLKGEIPHLLIFFVATIVQIVNALALLYLSCTVARLGVFRKFKVPAGILCFFIISWIQGNIGIETVNINLTNEHFENISPFDAVHMTLSELSAASLAPTVVNIVFIAIFIAAISYILKNRLEME